MVCKSDSHRGRARSQQRRHKMVFDLSVMSYAVSHWCVRRVPQSVGDNRFGNWLANARDWNVSRNRYWGTPLPLWASDDMEEVSHYFASYVQRQESNISSCQRSFAWALCNS